MTQTMCMHSLVVRRYDMPGEDNVMQSELFLYDIAAMAGAVITEPDGARKKLEPKPLSLVLSCLALSCLVFLLLPFASGVLENSLKTQNLKQNISNALSSSVLFCVILSTIRRDVEGSEHFHPRRPLLQLPCGFRQPQAKAVDGTQLRPPLLHQDRSWSPPRLAHGGRPLRSRAGGARRDECPHGDCEPLEYVHRSRLRYGEREVRARRR